MFYFHYCGSDQDCQAAYVAGWHRFPNRRININTRWFGYAWVDLRHPLYDHGYGAAKWWKKRKYPQEKP